MRKERWFIESFDESQQAVMDVPLDENLIVTGRAGSGKTNMAVHRASMSGNNFWLITFTVALRKMARYGIRTLGLDETRVVHHESWKKGIELDGEVFCLINVEGCGFYYPWLLILKQGDHARFFVDHNMREKAVSKIVDLLGSRFSQINSYLPLLVTITYRNFVSSMIFKTFGRYKGRREMDGEACHERWFEEVCFLNSSDSRRLAGIVEKDGERCHRLPSAVLFREKEKEDKASHLVIDEGQDFSLFDYENDFIPWARKSVSIFGDDDQKIYNVEKGWMNIESHVDLGFERKRLKHVYRVSRYVADIIKRGGGPDLLRENKHEERWIKTHGPEQVPKPVIVEFKSSCGSCDEIKFIFDTIEREKLTDVAILVPRDQEANDVYLFCAGWGIDVQAHFKAGANTCDILGSRLCPGELFREVSTLDVLNNDIPSLLTYARAKGLEYENVFIPFADSYTELSRVPFYVAMTRSSKNLFITYSGERTSLLSGVTRDNAEIMEMDDPWSHE
jgi:hypothetical protein